jgi:hypothetical protein
MRERLHATAVIARTQATELLLSPGPYAALAAGIAIGWVLCSGFAGAIDSSGFDPRLDPAWDFLTRAFSGAFGPVFVERMLAEGPFLLILAASSVPLLVLLVIGSVVRFGTDKASGALELIVSGPADGTSCFLGSFLKDAAAAAAGLVVIALYCAVLATARNLSVGPTALAAVPVIFLVALSISAIGLLCSILVANAGAALALFAAVCLVFLGTLAGSLGASVSSFRAGAQAASRVIQWLSPFYYAGLCAEGYGGGRPLEYGGGLCLLAVLTAAVLAAGHLVIRRRGVRP